MNTVIMLAMVVVFTIGTIGVAVVIAELLWPADTERQRQQQRLRQAERAIIDIARWEQETILAELRRRTRERRPENWSSPRPPVVDGEVLHIEDEPGGSRR